MPTPILQDLLTLSHDLGREDRGLAILGEGNTSARLSDDTFLVKASGACLGASRKRALSSAVSPHCCQCWKRTACPTSRLTTPFSPPVLIPRQKAFRRSRLPCLAALPARHQFRRPHPRNDCQSNPMLARARRILRSSACFPTKSSAAARLGLLPYTDPGLKLAQAIRRETEAFIRTQKRPPRVILMQNHGLITLGNLAIRSFRHAHG